VIQLRHRPRLLRPKLQGAWAPFVQTLTTPLTTNPPLSVARADAKSGVAGPLALKVLAVSILLPDEVGFEVSGLRFSAARVILLVLTPVLLIRFALRLAAGRYRFVWSDLLALLTGFWMLVALANMDGVQSALNHGGPIALEFCIGYMAARFLLAEHGQAVSFINFLCWAIAVVGLLGLSDTLTHSFFVHDVTRGLTGGRIFLDAGDRLGLIRAASTHEHPILFGFTCSVGLLLAISMPIRARGFAILACALGAFLALSSGPIQGALLGFSLLMYNRVMAGIRFRWASLIGLTSAGIIMVFTFVENPLGYVFRHLVFDTESGYFRLFIWQQGSAAVATSPWFGLGWVTPEYYEVPITVDNMWLVWALTFGIPGSLLLALSILGAASLPTNGSRASLTGAESKLGTSLSILIFVILFVGLTVDFYGNAWILIPVLAGIRAHLGELGRVSAEASR
jgi:O-antigen ligase